MITFEQILNKGARYRFIEKHQGTVEEQRKRVNEEVKIKMERWKTDSGSMYAESLERGHQSYLIYKKQFN